MSVDDLDDLDPARAPEVTDAQIEAEQAMDEGETEEAMEQDEMESIDEGAMDEESDGGMDSDEA